MPNIIRFFIYYETLSDDTQAALIEGEFGMSEEGYEDWCP
ncbi:hypothetical protein GCM10010969_21370 [Saccharibacillus kuerlensis]|uniref:Uncharacterized protein n=1 Tax=Saccharibacillus kuerlensis TaxID=459527 RepID=A0ABQ2L2E1_9BACL|nr:hypothetical protein GCM10010969_21370 [Saccharibacillus kuerlensis]